jgi:hypothetical protein
MLFALLTWTSNAFATEPISVASLGCPRHCFGYHEIDFQIVPPNEIQVMVKELEPDKLTSFLVTVVKLDGEVEFSVGGTVLGERNLIDPKTSTYQVAVPETAIDKGLEIAVTNLGRNSPVWELSIEGSSKPLDF